VRAAVEVQLYTGARPSEVLGLRPCDLQRGGSVQLARGISAPLGDVWAAILARHKTAHHGHARGLLFGPRARAAVQPLLGRAPEAPLSAPREAYLWYCAQRHKTPNLAGRRNRIPGDRYAPDSYRQAIRYGCKAAGVPVWVPYQLRHAAATSLAAEFGPEV